MLRLIREEEPPRPSTRLSELDGLAAVDRRPSGGTEPAKLTRLVRGELDWIVMKALEKDRNRRYETANGFAADVQRYLADEPVQACPPSAGYRLRKFARRNKRALATAGLLGVVLFVALGAIIASALWAAVQADARAKIEADAKKELEFNLYLRNIPLAQVEADLLNWGAVDKLLKGCPVRSPRLGVRLPQTAGRRPASQLKSPGHRGHQRQPRPRVQSGRAVPRRPGSEQLGHTLGPRKRNPALPSGELRAPRSGPGLLRRLPPDRRPAPRLRVQRRDSQVLRPENGPGDPRRVKAARRRNRRHDV